MPSLFKRLQSLGVQIGTQNLPPQRPRPASPHPIDSVLPGQWRDTPHGEVFTVETKYKADFKVGAVELKPCAPLGIIAAWARDPRLNHLTLDQFVFLDTETTGLAGGTGTYTFLVGVGRFLQDEFHLAQFFLQDPVEESAQLAALEEFLAPCKAVVSFNGKSFDIPLLNTRFLLHGWPPPLADLSHLDLLHLARRLWKTRLPSRALGDLEADILGTTRSDQDVPGWMVPDLYFDYLRSGDARPLRSVFYHNEMDILSLAALLNHMTSLVADPMSPAIEHGLDILALGKLYADMGHLDTAAEIYHFALAHNSLDQPAYWRAVEQLSYIHKKRGDYPAAIALWEQAATSGHLYAHVELAKYYEHRARDFATAHRWTQAGMEIVSQPDFPALERQEALAQLLHRKNRLERRLNTSFCKAHNGIQPSRCGETDSHHHELPQKG